MSSGVQSLCTIDKAPNAAFKVLRGHLPASAAAGTEAKRRGQIGVTATWVCDGEGRASECQRRARPIATALRSVLFPLRKTLYLLGWPPFTRNECRRVQEIKATIR